MKLVIGADLVPTKTNRDAFAAADMETLLGSGLRGILKAADYRIFNLEAPLTDEPNPIRKCGSNMKINPAAAAGLAAMGVDLVTLANNHIMDHGAEGLESTFAALGGQGIAWVGAGKNLQEAACPYIFEKDGLRVGIYACAEHEFSIAGEDTPGANPFDPLWSLDHIRELKQRCDYLIVLHHGGKEEYAYPSPELQRLCRRMADKGADLVICQHSHCIGCREEWNGSTLIYGQGNFLFDTEKQNHNRTSLLIEAEVTAGQRQVRYIPLVKSGNGVRTADPGPAAEILAGFEKRSGEILEEDFVKERFSREARVSVLEYYGRSLGRKRYLLFRAADLICGGRLRDRCYTAADALALMNTLSCEAHRELYSRALEDITLEKDI